MSHLPCNADLDCPGNQLCTLLETNGTGFERRPPIGDLSFQGVCVCQPSLGMTGNDCQTQGAGGILTQILYLMLAWLPGLIILLMSVHHLASMLYRYPKHRVWNSANKTRGSLILSTVLAYSLFTVSCLNFFPTTEVPTVGVDKVGAFGAIVRGLLTISSMAVVILCLDITIVWISIALASMKLQTTKRDSFEHRSKTFVLIAQTIFVGLTLGTVFTPKSEIASFTVGLYLFVIIMMCLWGGHKLHKVINVKTVASSSTSSISALRKTSNLSAKSSTSGPSNQMNRVAKMILHASKMIALSLTGFLIPFIAFIGLKQTRSELYSFGLQGAQMSYLNFFFLIGFIFQNFLHWNILKYLKDIQSTKENAENFAKGAGASSVYADDASLALRKDTTPMHASTPLKPLIETQSAALALGPIKNPNSIQSIEC